MSIPCSPLDGSRGGYAFGDISSFYLILSWRYLEVQGVIRGFKGLFGERLRAFWSVVFIPIQLKEIEMVLKSLKFNGLS